MDWRRQAFTGRTTGGCYPVPQSSSAGLTNIMANRDLISGLVMFAFGILMLAYVIPQEIVEGGDYTISPALLPQICAVGITALSALLVAKTVSQRRRNGGDAVETEETRPMPWAPAIVALTAVTAAVVIFRVVHPAPAVLFLVAALMLYMGERRWYFVIGLPVALLGIGYLLFYEVLGLVVR